jgi:hypothetical protein
MMTIRKLIVGLLFLLVLLVVQRMARGQNGQGASQTGTAQAQPQAAGFDAPAGFDSPAAGFDNPSQTDGLLGVVIFGYAVGALIVAVQRLRRWLFPASERTIVLDLKPYIIKDDASGNPGETLTF